MPRQAQGNGSDDADNIGRLKCFVPTSLGRERPAVKHKHKHRSPSFFTVIGKVPILRIHTFLFAMCACFCTVAVKTTFIPGPPLLICDRFETNYKNSIIINLMSLLHEILYGFNI